MTNARNFSRATSMPTTRAATSLSCRARKARPVGVTETALAGLAHEHVQSDSRERGHPDERSDPEVVARRKGERKNRDDDREGRYDCVSIVQQSGHRLDPIDGAPTE